VIVPISDLSGIGNGSAFFYEIQRHLLEETRFEIMPRLSEEKKILEENIKENCPSCKGKLTKITKGGCVSHICLNEDCSLKIDLSKIDWVAG